MLGWWGGRWHGGRWAGGWAQRCVVRGWAGPALCPGRCGVELGAVTSEQLGLRVVRVEVVQGEVERLDFVNQVEVAVRVDLDVLERACL